METPANPITADEVDDLVPLVFEIPEARCDDDEILLVQAFSLFFPFSKTALAEHEPAIRALLDRVAPEFKETGGKGACASGWPWPDSPLGQVRHEALIALGLAVGKIRWLAPREAWAELFPDGNPYLVVLAEPGEFVPPPVPLHSAAPRFGGLVPWVKNRGRRLYTGAKKIVKVKVRHQKPKR